MNEYNNGQYQPNPGMNSYGPQNPNPYANVQRPANYGYSNYAQPQPDPYNNPAIPPQYRPIKPWGYIGYMLLYSIPLVGFIMLIVNACSD